MKTHRKLSLDFIKSMVLVITKNKKLFRFPEIIEKYNCLEKFDNIVGRNSLKESLRECLIMFFQIMEKEIVDKTFNFLYHNKIKDTKDKRLEKALLRWKSYNSNSKIIAE